MIRNEEKKTTKWQRIGILFVAIFLLGATFALYASLIIQYNTDSATNATIEEKQQRLQQVYSEYVSQTNAQAQELSKVYFDDFVQYKSRAIAFNAADVNELVRTDLVEGDGAEVTDANFTDYSAYYIGWLPDGTVFDSSLNDTVNPTELKSPLEGSTSMIQGWLEGIVGMKIGGVREITIPYLMAYGDEGTETIPGGSPLKFVIKLIPTPEPVEAADEMTQLYYELYGKSE